MNSGVALALDVGGRRIGVARASLIARISSPLLTIDRTKTGDPAELIQNLIKNEGATVLVVGLPRDINSRETEQTAIVREFVQDLSKKIELPIVMQDEAVTSIEAEARLKASGRNYDKADIDAEAAAVILEDYLKQQAGNTA